MPVDYVALGLFGAVAGLCGVGVVAQPCRGWREPLVQWLCLLGPSGAGKSPALAAARGLITGRSRSCVLGEGSLAAVASAMAAHPRGAVLWRDELAAWIGGRGTVMRGRWREAWNGAPFVLNRGTKGEALRLDRFALSVVGGLQPELLARTLGGVDDGLAARFLYAWPAPAAWRPLDTRAQPDDVAAQKRLACIADRAGTADDPVVLPFDESALAAFEAFAAGRHEEARNADGAMAGWLGKSGGTVARLAALLALLGLSEGAAEDMPAAIDAAMVRNAVGLWTDYFRPHAEAALGGRDSRGGVAGDGAACRVVRWLRDTGTTLVSREEIRVAALGRTVDAAGADRVIARLEEGGVLRRAAVSPPANAGRPCGGRWEVIPALPATVRAAAPREAAANTANSGNEISARRGRSVAIDLPTLDDATDTLEAQTRLVEAVARAELTPDEGLKIARLLQFHSRTQITVRVEDALNRMDALMAQRARAEREDREDRERAWQANSALAVSSPVEKKQEPPVPESSSSGPRASGSLFPLSEPEAHGLEVHERARQRSSEPVASFPVEKKDEEPSGPEPSPEESQRAWSWADEMLAESVGRARGSPNALFEDIDDLERDGSGGSALVDYDPLEDA